jgi:hypothetical protein
VLLEFSEDLLQMLELVLHLLSHLSLDVVLLDLQLKYLSLVCCHGPLDELVDLHHDLLHSLASCFPNLSEEVLVREMPVLLLLLRISAGAISFT